MNKGIIGGIVIVVGAAICAPYFMGNAIEPKFEQSIQDLQTYLHRIDPDFNVRQENYQKGWFSSSSRVVLSLSGQDIPIDNKITHDPFGYFGLGKIESSITLKDSPQLQNDIESTLATIISLGKYNPRSSNTKGTISQLFADQSPLSITSKIGFSNAVSIDIYSPPIDNKPLPDDPSTIINWGGIKGTLVYNDKNLDTNITIPQFKLSQNKHAIDIKTTTITSTGYYGNDYEHWRNTNTAGKAFLNIEKFSFSDDQSTFSTQLNLMMASTDDQQFLGFDTALKLTNIELPKSAHFDLADNNLVELTIKLTDIPKQTLIDYLVNFEKIEQEGRVPTDDEIQPLFEPVVINYLKGTPSLNAQFLVKDSEKQSSLSLDLTLPTDDMSIKTLEQAIASAGDRFEATLTSNTSESFIDEMSKQGLLPMPKEALLQSLTENNLIVSKNGEFSSKTEFKKGHFYVNGQPNPELDQSFPFLLQSLMYY